MSRGAGKWQRRVLEALEERPALFVVHLLPERFTRSEYVALLRAVNTLERAGRVGVDRYWCWATKPGRVVVRRPGVSVSVDKLLDSQLINI